MKPTSIYEQYTPPTGGAGGYFKPEDGKSIRARIVSEPVILTESYQGDAPNVRYTVIIYNFDADEAQVFKMPKSAFNQLRDLAVEEDWGDPLEKGYDVKIKRTGKGTDTVWNITPSPAKNKLTEDQQTQVESINLVDRISAGNGVMNVSWLREYVANGNKFTDNTKTANDFVIDDDGETINLDDIPFGGDE